MATALIAVLALTLASCDDDSAIAYTLEGTWKGNMYVSSTYNGQTYDATYSEICFSRDPYAYSSGTGYWIDYYDNSGWGNDYVANHIQWTVTNGRIQVYFQEEGTSVTIEDYSLDDDTFRGTIYDGSNSVDFALYHTSSPNWNNFNYGYGSYAKSSSIGQTAKERPVRFFRTK